MKKKIKIIIIFIAAFINLEAQDTLVIQENETGFCAVDGSIVRGSTTVSGWTGDGYADSDPGVGKSISWQTSVPADGFYTFSWRYAIGGNPGSRDAKLLINGNVSTDSISFPHTGTWSNWTMSEPVELNLVKGSYKIRIEAYSSSGLGNYDYLMVTGSGAEATSCTPSYVVVVKSNNEGWGSVAYEPVQQYYDEGTLITFRASANSGYFFQSWTGEETSADSIFTFRITKYGLFQTFRSSTYSVNNTIFIDFDYFLLSLLV